MGIALGAIGLLGFIGCMVWFLILLIARKSKEPARLGIMACVILVFVGILTDIVSGDNAERRKSSQIDQSTVENDVSYSSNNQISQIGNASSSSSSFYLDTTELPSEEIANAPVKVDLKGRGWSDSGRSEPQYENILGYVVIDYIDTKLTKTDDCFNTLWAVPIYEKDKQFYVECGTIDHKTPVAVKSQELKHEGYGAYSGYLIVERLDNGEELCIDVGNFITNPYWESSDLISAVSTGYYIAEFNQKSDYFPVSKSNEKVLLDDGTKVLAVRKTGTYGRNGPDDSTNQIEAEVFKEWKYGYGGVSVFFNKEDLSIVY